MKKTAFIALTVTLLMALSMVTMAQAAPLKEKNNDKFQSFSVTGQFSFLKFLTGEHTYIPSEDKVNKLIIQFDESMLKYDITIGDRTYNLNKDFKYTGHAIFWYDDPVFGNLLGTLYPTGYRGDYHGIVEYTFDFSAVPGGIDGTLNMRAMHNAGGNPINSLTGTGDLQNVQIKAEITGNVFDSVTFKLTINHDGYVSGWPDVPPNP